MTDKILFSGSTHTVAGAEGYARSADGHFAIELPEPHPAAENLFAAAWSACFLGALGLVAGQRKIVLPETPSIDATIDLLHRGGGFELRARLDVAVPGIDRDVAQELIEAAHKVCPYSKAIAGNIEVELNLA
ncbi:MULTISPECIES: Ohr family peroxiredoxin [unclassified Sphingopyxis]|uniref:Ohr family peroxiredoxin n=1 Tax=unclassified Sphingopyxis TaxID=2614943 RepID=UPI000736FD9D|nr:MULTISPECIES: Ohr family peroxiredoxin [unclassified Sphingopyxis]KTE24250.1 peroxiredoxin [Sphingopyxis sp. HIX]KTE84466.1 peroxiredoxin [Sphingopyxis sp. HXXIV]